MTFSFTIEYEVNRKLLLGFWTIAVVLKNSEHDKTLKRSPI